MPIAIGRRQPTRTDVTSRNPSGPISSEVGDGEDGRHQCDGRNQPLDLGAFDAARSRKRTTTEPTASTNATSTATMASARTRFPDNGWQARDGEWADSGSSPLRRQLERPSGGPTPTIRAADRREAYGISPRGLAGARPGRRGRPSGTGRRRPGGGQRAPTRSGTSRVRRVGVGPIAMRRVQAATTLVIISAPTSSSAPTRLPGRRHRIATPTAALITVSSPSAARNGSTPKVPSPPVSPPATTTRTAVASGRAMITPSATSSSHAPHQLTGVIDSGLRSHSPRLAGRRRARPTW